jgi:hypothetical protein
MLDAGLDLLRKRLDVHVLRDDGTTVLVTAVSPDASALRTLVRRVAAEGEPAHRETSACLSPYPRRDVSK